MAFAPANNPQIALAMVVENAGFGGANAAPIARRVFDYWLLQQYPNELDMAAVQKGQAQVPLGKPRAVAEVPDLPGAPAGSAAMAAASAPTTAVALTAAPATAPASAANGKALSLQRARR
jgi:penicillin-binding protein 2